MAASPQPAPTSHPPADPPKTESVGARFIEVYDTTLRDGTQGLGVSLSLTDKLKITSALNEMGFDFIEGGYPLSNPKDVEYFERVRDLDLDHARVTAFGMTRRKGIGPEDDAGMRALVAAGTPVITIVGKTWDLHVDEVLGVSREENLAMIADSVRFCVEALTGRGGGSPGGGGEVMYDAEHFFDGYHANPEYALATLRAAMDAGATRLVLCDTNGGSLPDWIAWACREVARSLGLADPSPEHPTPTPSLAIHPHNDSGVAVANALAAIDAGCVQVQGTINGIGERCGNVDLTTVIANLNLKRADRYACLRPQAAAGLTGLARFVYELANLNLAVGQPFVGPAAFAHKGGMHVHAVNKLARSYEHVEPASVGNERRVLVSELSGASNIAATVGRKFGIAEDKAVQRRVLERVQDLEHRGYQFEAAKASYELLLYEALGRDRPYWTLDHYRAVIYKRDGDAAVTEATVKLIVPGTADPRPDHDGPDAATPPIAPTVEHRVAEGDGPVDAISHALRKALLPHYPALARVHLKDYKVRVVNPTAETGARVRVTIDFAAVDPDRADEYFTTIGVNENIVDASWEAIASAYRYFLLEHDVRPAHA